MATGARATTLSVFLERQAAQQEAAMKADLAQRQRDIQEAIDNELESFYDSDSDSGDGDDDDDLGVHRDGGGVGEELSESSLDAADAPVYRHNLQHQHRHRDEAAEIRPPIEGSSVDDDDHHDGNVDVDEETSDDEDDEMKANRRLDNVDSNDGGDTASAERDVPVTAAGGIFQLALLPASHPAHHLMLPSEATSRSTAQLATLSPETTGCGLSSAEYSGPQHLPGMDRNPIQHPAAQLNILPPSMRHSQLTRPRGVDVGVSVVPENQRDLDQLDILYRARGRHIEELKAQLTELQESSAKEARLLKHKLALTEANRESAEKVASGTEDRLKEALEQIRSLKEESAKRQELTAKLLAENEQLQRQLTEAGCQNEALTAQLTEMTTAGTIGRVRDQQENFIQSLRNKKDEEIFYLKDRIDRLQSEAEQRQADLDAARALATKLGSQQSQQVVDANKQVAAMAQQLHEAQQRCQDLLADGADSEIVGNLRHQLAQRDLAKSITEEMNSALQEEIADLREQLAMYETAERLLPTSLRSPAAGTAGATEGGREATSTSMPGVGASTDRDKSVACLRAELLRCQDLYKQKREKVSELQKELIQLKKSSHESRLRCERAELALNDQREQSVAMETRIRSEAQKQQEEVVAAAVAKLKAEEEQLRKQLAAAEERAAELESRLSSVQSELSQSSEAQRSLSAQCEQLQSEFAAAWDRAEQDKAAEFERIQRTCQAHFDLCREKMREELLAGFAEERRAASERYEARLAEAQAVAAQLGQERRQLEAQLDEASRKPQTANCAIRDRRPAACQTDGRAEERAETADAAVQASQQQPPELSLTVADPLAEQETELGRRLQQCYLAAISRIRDEVVGHVTDNQERAERRLRRSQRSLCARFVLHLRRDIEEKFSCPDAELSVDSVLQLLNQSLNRTMRLSLPSASHLRRSAATGDLPDNDGDSTPTASASGLSTPPVQQRPLPPPPPVAPRSSQASRRPAATTSTPAEKDAGGGAAL
ncbi:hypothetical protein BOX15_Mlig032283g2 [Macrostomum lignano]|uniref:Uncharacterized protein n=1 Tax=Macrostomum lignano TaxID=282301 RepID=A0A267FSF5_9PLAT|nr:hypothetical protein BOX15_Mlig032283g2 [Macrostomum lignano]